MSLRTRSTGIVVGGLAMLGIALAWGLAAQEPDYAQLRRAMVEEQLRARDIKDEAVLRAMAKVPRHEFVPQGRRAEAYADYPLPIGEGQTISQPYIVALMTQAVHLRRGDKVLEIGTGSGYQAAVLAEITPNVYTIEILPTLARRAEATLKRLAYNTVRTRIGDGYQGWKAYAPFDAIIVTCAPDHIPQPLIEQLADGGRMVIPVGPQDALRGQRLLLIKKHKDKLSTTTIAPVWFVPMLREQEKQ